MQWEIKHGSKRKRRSAAVGHQPLSVVALLAAVAVVAFTAGSLLGSHYSATVAQLSVDFQLAQLHQQGTQRLAATVDRLLRSGRQAERADLEAEQQGRRHAREVQHDESQLLISDSMLDEPTLSFQVCNGFANQRVAVLSGTYFRCHTPYSHGCMTARI